MRKYIKQIDRDDFVYPNEVRSTFDNEIIHEINSNYPTGTVNSVTLTNIGTNTLVFDVNWSYLRNGSKLFQNIFGEYNYVTFHLLTPDDDYYKPWRLIGTITTSNSSITGNTDTTVFNLSPDDFGLTGFTEGDYWLEVRFLAKNSVYPVCTNVSFLYPLPTPTPTPTPTMTSTPGLSPTATPTPTMTPTLTSTSTPTPTPSSTPQTILANCYALTVPIESTINNGHPLYIYRNLPNETGEYILWSNILQTPTDNVSYFLYVCSTFEPHYYYNWVQYNVPEITVVIGGLCTDDSNCTP